MNSIVKPARSKPARRALFKLGGLLGIFLALACADSDSAVGPESDSPSLSPASLDVYPDSVSVGVNGEVQFEALTDSLASYKKWRGGRWDRVVSVTVRPDSLAVAPGTAHSLSASGKTASGSVVQTILRWIGTGGTISSTGK